MHALILVIAFITTRSEFFALVMFFLVSELFFFFFFLPSGELRVVHSDAFSGPRWIVCARKGCVHAFLFRIVPNVSRV
jgi:hypothetical protein